MSSGVCHRTLASATQQLVDYSTTIEGLGACAVIEDAYEAVVQKDQLRRHIDPLLVRPDEAETLRQEKW